MAGPGWASGSRHRPFRTAGSKGLTLVALYSAVMILNLDMTIVTVALPDLVRQTRASTTDLQWVVDAYNLLFAALMTRKLRTYSYRFISGPCRRIGCNDLGTPRLPWRSGRSGA